MFPERNIASCYMYLVKVRFLLGEEKMVRPKVFRCHHFSFLHYKDGEFGFNSNTNVINVLYHKGYSTQKILSTPFQDLAHTKKKRLK